MGKNYNSKNEKLRSLAEDKLKKLKQNYKLLAPEDIKLIFYELQVHQIELESQNEELRKTHIELDNSREKYFNFYNHAPVGYLTINEKGLITEANLMAGKMLGVAQVKLKNQPIHKFILNEDQDKYYLHRKRLFETGEIQQCDLRILGKVNSEFWVNIQSVLWEDSENNKFCKLTITDISKRKESEYTLIENEERFRTIAEAIPAMISFSNIYDSTILFTNNFYNDTFGCRKEDIIGRKMPDVYFNPAARKRMFDILRENGSVSNYELKVKKSDGIPFWILSEVRPIMFDGKPAIVEVSIDISDIKYAQEQLIKNSAELKNLNATKDKFIRIMVHDLKNSLSSLIGSSEYLAEKLETGYSMEKILKFSTIFNSASKNAYNVLINLLEWLKTQSGEVQFNPEKINLKEKVDNALEYVKLLAVKKNIEVYSELMDDLLIKADKNMIGIILRNLLGNAMKFTTSGGKVIVNAQQNATHVTITIKDTGIGLAKEDIDKLFKLETNLTSEGTAHEIGTGLGLILCKEFVEKHGGKIWVESKVGQGSEFIFTLPG